MNHDTYANSGIFSKFYEISVPPKIKKLCGETSMGLIIIGNRDDAIRLMSLMCKCFVDEGFMMPSPQMASMAKVFEYQKRSYRDAEAEDLIRNRITRPPWLGLYFFDITLGKIFDAEIHTSFKYWFMSMVTSRAMGRAPTVIAADEMFKGKKLIGTLLPKEWKELCDGKVKEIKAKDYV